MSELAEKTKPYRDEYILKMDEIVKDMRPEKRKEVSMLGAYGFAIAKDMSKEETAFFGGRIANHYSKFYEGN